MLFTLAAPKEGAASFTRIAALTASPLTTAWLPKLSAASSSLSSRIVALINPIASAGTAAPSPSLSPSRTV